jgi:hypothetical protein
MSKLETKDPVEGRLDSRITAETKTTLWSRLREFLFGPEVCRDCALLRCEGEDVNCQCDWGDARYDD